MTARLNVSVPAAAVVADPMSTRGVVRVITNDQVITGEQARAIAEAIAHTPGAPTGPVQIIKPAVNAQPAEPPKRKQFVSRRTFDGLRPRAPRVPTTAEESLSLRKAELKRRRKAAARQAQLLRSVPVIDVPSEPVRGEPWPGVEYEPAAPAAFVVIDLPGDTP